MSVGIDLNQVLTFIRERAESSEYRNFMVQLLCDLVEIDTTTTGRSLADIVESEHAAFDRLESALREFAGPQVAIERAFIDPAIEKHPYYTRAYYTADEKNPDGLPAAEAYKNRYNLFAVVNPQRRSEIGKPIILNAHMDIVSPFYTCRLDEKAVHGRGACDDKGSVVMMAACMKLLTEIENQFGPFPSQPHVYQFVIEEETGGNGSLSAAIDPRFQGFETIICESTKLVPHPANRGAMWFQLDLNASPADNRAAAVPFILRELAQLGQQLRAESVDPLFPKDYVQVNFGVLDHFGKHPSAVNDYVAFELTIHGDRQKIEKHLEESIRSGLDAYCRVYTDRTQQIDPQTGQPKLKQHYKITPQGETYLVEIFGIGGHMGAMLLCDNAMIKSGYVLSSAIENLKSRGFDVACRVRDESDGPALVITGGVGFTPCHRMVDLQGRLLEAARRGVQRYNETTDTAINPEAVKMTFDKLHNEAYVSPADCPAMQAFKLAYRVTDRTWPTPIAFRASCDARIYGNSGHNTITFGPGDMVDAHSDHEKMEIESLQRALEMLALTVWGLLGGAYDNGTT